MIATRKGFSKDSASLCLIRLGLHEWLLGKLRKADGQKGLVYLCCRETQHDYSCTKHKHNNRFATAKPVGLRPGREPGTGRHGRPPSGGPVRSFRKEHRSSRVTGHFVTLVLYGKNVTVLPRRRRGRTPFFPSRLPAQPTAGRLHRPALPSLLRLRASSPASARVSRSKRCI